MTEVPEERTGGGSRILDVRPTLGMSAGIVLVVAAIAWLLANFGCGGSDTSPIAPRGSSQRDFCDGVDLTLFLLAAPAVTLACGALARRGRSAALASIGLFLGLAIAITPLVLESSLSRTCPGGADDINGECQP
jgi:hypothetical protein